MYDALTTQHVLNTDLLLESLRLMVSISIRCEKKERDINTLNGRKIIVGYISKLRAFLLTLSQIRIILFPLIILFQIIIVNWFEYVEYWNMELLAPHFELSCKLISRLHRSTNLTGPLGTKAMWSPWADKSNFLYIYWNDKIISIRENQQLKNIVFTWQDFDC